MPAEEIDFRVAFEGPLTEFTRRNPHATVMLWCDWRKEVLEVSGARPAELAALREDLAKVSANIEGYAIDEGTHVFVLDCVGLPHDLVNEAIDDSHGLNVPPTRFEAGWEHYSMVSFSEVKSRTLFKTLRSAGRQVELLSKRPLLVQPLLNTRSVGANSLFSGLTEKQLEALLLAHKHGLYGSPRRTTAAAIAEAQGLSRSTFEEHLRKAENKLVQNLVPYLELYVKARKASAMVKTA